MKKIQQIVGGSIQTNCYLIEDNGKVILFDFVPEIENVIIQNKYLVDKIFITHAHFDHFEGLADFQKRNNFELCLSEKTFKLIEDPGVFAMFLDDYMLKNIKNVNLNNVLTLKDNDVIVWNGLNIKIQESPGHSPDSLMFVIDELKTIITGDTIFQNSIGRTDLPGGDYHQLLNSAKRLFDTIDDDYGLNPGHGPVTTVAREKVGNFFLRELF